jgi:hypothetical protein
MLCKPDVTKLIYNNTKDFMVHTGLACIKIYTYIKVRRLESINAKLELLLLEEGLEQH